MAVSELRHAARLILGAELRPELRYRCLVIETPDLHSLADIHRHAVDVLHDLGIPAVSLESKTLFDEIGAQSCSRITQTLFELATEQCTLLLGPLNFLDYWAPQVRATFWAELAAWQRGPGMVLFDVPRAGDCDSSFRVIAKVPGTDIRYMNSRLAATQDGLA